MDARKCEDLKRWLSSETQPARVAIKEFFDGNDDEASIGCNLLEHPRIDVFQKILVGLLDRPDVEAVYAQIAEVDPGEESWPFTDTILVSGKISVDELRKILEPLQPTDVGGAEQFWSLKALVGVKPTMLAAWWD